MKVTLVQMTVSPDKNKNLIRAASEAKAAALRGSDMVILPEMFCCPYDNNCFPDYAEEEGGFVWQTLSSIARENHIWLVGGTMPERSDGKIYNTCYVFDRSGAQAAKYRKIHLFDINIEGGQRFMESNILTAGNAPAVFQTEFGVFGLCICFDLRFPELFLETASLGAQAIIVPAAFNLTTGPKHWELLYRARAVDTQAYTIGVSSARDCSASYVSYGHSIVCDPWAEVMALAGAEDCVIDAELDLSLAGQVRRQIPLIR